MRRSGETDSYLGTAAGRGFIPDQASSPSPVSENVKRFCEKVAGDFEVGDDVTHVTDRFFKHVEDRYLEAYKLLVQTVGGTLSLNSQIGRWIKDHYQLGNIDVVPARQSKLIRAYTTHSRL